MHILFADIIFSVDLLVCLCYFCLILIVEKVLIVALSCR